MASPVDAAAAATATAAAATVTTSKDTPKSDVEKAIKTVRERIGQRLEYDPSLGPLFLKIAFYDALSYNPIDKAHGPDGWIRFSAELSAEDKRAIGELDTLKNSNDTIVAPYISYADLYQLAGIEAVKKAIGQIVKFQHGRPDLYAPSKIPIINEDAASMRNTFYRIGFNDEEIVALSWAYYYWMNPPSKTSPQTSPQQPYYTLLLEIHKSNKFPSTGTPDDQQQRIQAKPSQKYWKCLIVDNSFYKHVERFQKNEDAFHKAYVVAHQKLSELGFKQFPEPLPIEANYHDMRHGIVFAVAMTILVGFMGFFYEASRIN